MSRYEFPQAIVEKMLSRLSNEQRTFMEEYIRQSKRSKWLEVLARRKGVEINFNDDIGDIEKALDDWILDVVLDCGEGNRDYECECGKKLRYQYIVRHSSTGRVLNLGETCFENYTGLSNEVVQEVKKGFYHINEERDEILSKIGKKLLFDYEYYEEIEIPELYKEQLRLKLHLSSRQLNYLNRKVKDLWEKRRVEEERVRGEKRNAEINDFYYGLSEEQQNHLKEMGMDVLEEVYELNKGTEVRENHNYLLSGIRVPEKIQRHIELNFPLVKRQVEELYVVQKEKRELKKVSFSSSSISYKDLIGRHIETLRRVREKEDKIPKGLLRDWELIQEDVKELQKGNEIDYGIWKTRLRNLIIPIRVENDYFL